jgi:RNA polymerase sigma-70 factor (ECF subfamily)
VESRTERLCEPRATRAEPSRGSARPDRGDPAPSGPSTPLADQALADLHARYRRRLEAVAFRLLHDHDEAEDVVQRVFTALPRVDFRGHSSLWTYLYRAAVNGALTVLRKRRRREVAETELRVRAAFGDAVAAEEASSPEARVLEGEILSAVASALLHVKPQHRRALVLRIVWGLTNTEIAEREGVPLPTVGTWLRRGREELRARLGPLLRDLDLGEDLP